MKKKQLWLPYNSKRKLWFKDQIAVDTEPANHGLVIYQGFLLA